MPALSTSEASELLAQGIEKAKPTVLREINAELFPEEVANKTRTVSELTSHVRGGLTAEELVDLWNVVFPAHRNVWYDEEDMKIHYNEQTLGYAEGIER
ncbi:hypothetical protein DTL42_00570 [Bremerella cremea]|uniref:Uncharacterized protein n=1 Tax=Bremerella cremea TaxID=1031537 RepID=A0A368KXD6_9BACT|nr:hypothetical protein [Bremerella cremea]RCS55918.1 hypothetical protein DTL42_00570 [Bremerella cremea]